MGELAASMPTKRGEDMHISRERFGAEPIYADLGIEAANSDLKINLAHPTAETSSPSAAESWNMSKAGHVKRQPFYPTGFGKQGVMAPDAS